MVVRNLDTVQKALDVLTSIETGLNILEYEGEKLPYFLSLNTNDCDEVRDGIEKLLSYHITLVEALLLYGNTYLGAETDQLNYVSASYGYDTTDSPTAYAYISGAAIEKTFWEKTQNQIFKGDYCDDVTWLGTAVAIGMALVGVDAPCDVRDFSANVQNSNYGMAALNALALLPVVGAVTKIGSASVDATKAITKIDALGEVTATTKVVRVSSAGNEFIYDQGTFLLMDTTGTTLKSVSNVTKIDDFNYVAKNADLLSDMRKEFNSTVQPEFLKTLSTKSDELLEAGFTDLDIAKLSTGKVPTGYEVHHKLSLHDGGTNDFENLVLIDKESHSIFTRYQLSLTKSSEFVANSQINCDWLIPEGFIYGTNISIN